MRSKALDEGSEPNSRNLSRSTNKKKRAFIIRKVRLRRSKELAKERLEIKDFRTDAKNL